MAEGAHDRARYDALIIGGGHNGLVCAAYLAAAGLKVIVLERRPIVGGAAITEELRPGFWFTTFSYALSLLRPEIVQDLELGRDAHGHRAHATACGSTQAASRARCATEPGASGTPGRGAPRSSSG